MTGSRKTDLDTPIPNQISLREMMTLDGRLGFGLNALDPEELAARSETQARRAEGQGVSPIEMKLHLLEPIQDSL